MSIWDVVITCFQRIYELGILDALQSVYPLIEIEDEIGIIFDSQINSSLFDFLAYCFDKLCCFSSISPQNTFDRDSIICLRGFFYS